MERDERRRATRLEMDVEEARKRLRPLATQTDGQKPSSSSLDDPTTELSTLVSQVTSERLKRVLEFLDFLETDFDRHITSLVSKDVRRVLPNGVLKSDVDSADSPPVGEVVA